MVGPHPGEALQPHAGHLNQAALHFIGRLVGKGNGQDVFRRHARFTKWANLAVRVRVFPDPAPATTRAGDPVCSTAACCWGESCMDHLSCYNVGPVAPLGLNHRHRGDA
jgi:hypothetical protein